MAFSLITTVGGADANSYASVAEGDTYHLGHPYAAVWNSASNDSKAVALAWATRLLDLYIIWFGWKTSASQNLMWPRQALTMPDGFTNVPNNAIPQQVKDATAELARRVIENKALPDPTTLAPGLGLTQLTVGPLNFTFDPASLPEKKFIDDFVFMFVRTWGTLAFPDNVCIPLGRA